MVCHDLLSNEKAKINQERIEDLGVGVVPVELVADDVLSRMGRLTPL